MIHYITTNGIGNAWVAAELKIVQEAGIPCKLHSMRAPSKNFFGSEWANQINKSTKFLYPLKPLKMARSLATAPLLYRERFFKALLNALFSPRENPRARVAAIAHLLVACDWARDLRDEDVHLIHSQWIQSGGTIGWYAARLLDKPFSFTGHAVDLFRDRVALKDKIKDAAFIVSISEFHSKFYIDEGARPEQLNIVYCGIDLGEFKYTYRPIADRARILSFGRLVEKKGFDTLIEAAAELRRRGREIEVSIAGSGPEEDKLRNLSRALGVEDIVEVTGKPLLQEEIADWFSNGHIFAQPCCWSSDNDVDGIPRSLMEAMACGLPSITTRVAGLPDLVVHEKSGLLVEPKAPKELADAIERMIDEPELTEQLSKGGRAHVEQHFNLVNCLDPLVKLFRQRLGQDADSPS